LRERSRENNRLLVELLRSLPVRDGEKSKARRCPA